MKKILVSLVSEQTIPNILMASHYKPDVYWFVSTKRMEQERRTEFIENTLRLMGIINNHEINKVIVDQDSLIDCIDVIGRLVERTDDSVEYIVNITAGNKLMALAAYETFREIGQKVVINYMPLLRNEFIQVFPKKKPLKIYDIKKRLNVEEYLQSYGFEILNKDKVFTMRENALSRRDTSQWIMDNYEKLKGMLGFFYKNLRMGRDKKQYSLSSEFDRHISRIEGVLLDKLGVHTKANLISKELTKEETIYLTGGWLEEYVFNEVFSLAQEGLLDDVMIGINIKSISGAKNELDIAFVKDNLFYHIECKSLGDEERNLIRDEVYKKGALSTLLGKGKRRAFICTTHKIVKEHLKNRAKDYGVRILSISDVRGLREFLKERLGIK